MSKELKLLQWEILNNCDELHKIDRNSINIISDFSFEDHIELKDKDRGCRIYPYHFSEIPKYEFEWDDCPLFKISSNDVKRQVEIIKSWVLNKTIPSKIKSQFPEIKLNKLAEYYEKGEGIKGEFLESWDILENSYIKGLSNEYCEEAKVKDKLKLVKELRNFNLDESLRIGSQLSVLILSRAKRQGIDRNKPQIRIVFLGDNKMKIYPNLNNKSIECEVKYKGYLEEMIKDLLKEEIK